MPIVVKRPARVAPPPAPPSPAASLRRRRSECVARQLAPIIAEIRDAGHHGIAEIAKCLNERGVRAPSGGLLSYETTRRMLKELESLGLGCGPRTASEALIARHKKKRAREAAELAQLQERRKREHSDWDQ
jgi:hypothetical protein